MIESIAETAYNQAIALVNRRIIKGYERYHYINAHYATLPEYVQHLSIDDHKLVSDLAKRAFRNGLRASIR